MPLVSRSLTNLVQGVSQQPTPLRSPAQAELVENATQSAFGYCEKRIGSTHLAALGLTTSLSANDVFFGANFSDGTSYLILLQGLTNGPAVKVWDTGGNAMTVNTPNGVSYLAYTDTSSSKTIKFCQAGDTIYVANPSKLVAMTGATSPAALPQALVWIKNSNPPGAPGASYTITLDGVTATVADSSFNQTTNWGTGDIATSLASALITALGGSAALYTINVAESYIYIQRVNNADFTLSVSDTKGNDWTQVIKGSTQLLVNLPTKCQNGFRVTITGADGSPASAWYYVQFNVTDPSGTFGRGKWVETIAPAIATTLDPATMPFVITKSGATFTFAQGTWTNRLVGDTVTAPTPSFVGRYITDVFFYRDRLGFVSGGNRVSLSMSGLYYNFFPITVLAGLTDDDPIDVAVDIMDSSNIYHVTPTDTGCILWGDKSQFQLASPLGSNLTPRTVQSTHLTSFECHVGVKPVSIGNNFYYLSPALTANGQGGGDGNPNSDLKLMEYFYDWQSQNHDADEVSAHVPKMLRAFQPRLVACPKSNTLIEWDASYVGSFCYNDKISHIYQPQLRLYTFYFNGNEKVQASWSNWYFDEGWLSPSPSMPLGATIMAGCYLNGLFYMLRRTRDNTGTGEDVLLESIPVSPWSWDTDGNLLAYYIPQKSCLDRKVQGSNCSPSYNSGTNTTTWTLPYKAKAPIRVLNQDQATMPVSNVEVPCTYTLGSKTVTATGNYASGVNIMIGQQYTWLYQPSQQYIKDYRGNLDTSGRIQYLRWRVTYEYTGHLAYSVQSANRSPVTGTIINGDATLPSGQADFPVLARSTEAVIQLSSTHWLPTRIASLEWWANYFTAFQRIL